MIERALLAARGLPADVRWPLRRIGDVVELHYGKGLPERIRRPGEVRVFGSNGQCGWHDTAIGSGPTVVLGRKGQGPLGVEWCTERFWVIDTAYYVRVDAASIDLRFFYFLTKFVGLNHLKDGTSNPSLSRDVFLQQAFPLPPIHEQRRIVERLGAYDDLIENCERRIRVLDEMARALYREWFVQATPECETVPAQRLIDSGVLEINDGYRAKNSELGAPGLPFARAGNINGGFHFNDADVLSAANVAKANSKVSQVDDIVFTSKGTVGRFAKVRLRTPQFVYSPQLCFWRIRRPDTISPNYLFHWMQSREFLNQVDGVKGSTDMADYVSLTNQRRMNVRVPSAAMQRRADAFLQPIDELTGTLTDRRDNLRRTRDILLPRLLSGQLTLGDAE